MLRHRLYLAPQCHLNVGFWFGILRIVWGKEEKNQISVNHLTGWKLIWWRYSYKTQKARPCRLTDSRCTSNWMTFTSVIAKQAGECIGFSCATRMQSLNNSSAKAFPLIRFKLDLTTWTISKHFLKRNETNKKISSSVRSVGKVVM